MFIQITIHCPHKLLYQSIHEASRSAYTAYPASSKVKCLVFLLYLCSQIQDNVISRLKYKIMQNGFSI